MANCAILWPKWRMSSWKTIRLKVFSPSSVMVRSACVVQSGGIQDVSGLPSSALAGSKPGALAAEAFAVAPSAKLTWKVSRR